MTRLNRLKREARQIASAHGHRLGRFTTMAMNDEVASAFCLRCGAGCSVCSAPLNRINVVIDDVAIKRKCRK